MNEEGGRAGSEHGVPRVRLRGGDDRSYDVVVRAGARHEAGERARRVLGDGFGRAALIVDSGARWVAQDVIASLSAGGLRTLVVEVEGGEAVKTMAALERVLGALARARLERDEPVFVVGGGAVGDAGGLASALHRRGTPWVQVPTTLLAMVDASVGGKVGVNLDAGDGTVVKNGVGAFHQPRLVIADLAALRTLPSREFRAGLAECLKHALLGGSVPGCEGLGAWTKEFLRTTPVDGTAGDGLRELVERNVLLKARVVEADEREMEGGSGGRALLNLGHTFGHVLEMIDGAVDGGGEGKEGRLLHGEAVGLGLIAACRLGAELGVCGAGLEGEVRALVSGVGLPTSVAGLPSAAELASRTAGDKKARGGARRFVVPTGWAGARVVENPPEAAVAAGFESVRA